MIAVCDQGWSLSDADFTAADCRCPSCVVSDTGHRKSSPPCQWRASPFPKSVGFGPSLLARQLEISSVVLTLFNVNAAASFVMTRDALHQGDAGETCNSLTQNSLSRESLGFVAVRFSCDELIN